MRRHALTVTDVKLEEMETFSVPFGVDLEQDLQWMEWVGSKDFDGGMRTISHSKKLRMTRTYTYLPITRLFPDFTKDFTTSAR